MKWLAGPGIGLGSVFVLLLVVGELCYVLFWKKKERANPAKTKKAAKKTAMIPCFMSDANSDWDCGYAREAAFVGSFGGYPPPPSSPSSEKPLGLFDHFSSRVGSYDPHLQDGTYGFGKENEEDEEDDPEDERGRGGGGMMLPGMVGPPRLLFTIQEETKEDMDVLENELNKNENGNGNENGTYHHRHHRKGRSFPSSPPFESVAIDIDIAMPTNLPSPSLSSSSPPPPLSPPHRTPLKFLFDKSPMRTIASPSPPSSPSSSTSSKLPASTCNYTHQPPPLPPCHRGPLRSLFMQSPPPPTRPSSNRALDRLNPCLYQTEDWHPS